MADDLVAFLTLAEKEDVKALGMLEVNLAGLVAFSVLMEKDGGILWKAPRYIREKFVLCMTVDDPTALLDPGDRRLYDEWFRRWAK